MVRRTMTKHFSAARSLFEICGLARLSPDTGGVVVICWCLQSAVVQSMVAVALLFLLVPD